MPGKQNPRLTKKGKNTRLSLNPYPQATWPELSSFRASLVAQMVENLPATQETWIQSLGQEGPLEKEMAGHSSILAWRIP